MKQFLTRRWFLLALATVLAAGFLVPRPLEPVARNIPKNLVVAAVMFGMALPLEARTMFGAVRYPRAALTAGAINFAAIPLLAWGIHPWLPAEFGAGLLIAAAVPCTVASAVVWTRRGGGNDAVALVVALGTNLACFAVTPFWLHVTTGHSPDGGARSALDAAELVGPLLLVVALPVVVAQLLRLAPSIGSFATRHKVPLGVFCQIGMLTMVFTGAVTGGTMLQGQESLNVPWHGWFTMAAAAIGIHVLALFAGHGAAAVLGLSREDRIAVGFSGSQKTLLVGLKIATDYADRFGGLALFPMVVYHIGQLLLDTFVADHLRRRPQPESEPPAVD
jgi:sodium/bile acid cotransporter 7